MMKWVHKTKQSTYENINKKDEPNNSENDEKVKQKKAVAFRQTVTEVPADYSKQLDILFKLGYRTNIRVTDGDNVHIVNLTDEGQVTKTVLKS